MNHTTDTPTLIKSHRSRSGRIRWSVAAIAITVAIGAATVLAGGPTTTDGSADEQAHVMQGLPGHQQHGGMGTVVTVEDI